MIHTRGSFCKSRNLALTLLSALQRRTKFKLRVLSVTMSHDSRVVLKRSSSYVNDATVIRKMSRLVQFNYTHRVTRIDCWKNVIELAGFLLAGMYDTLSIIAIGCGKQYPRLVFDLVNENDYYFILKVFPIDAALKKYGFRLNCRMRTSSTNEVGGIRTLCEHIK